jgi:hypothetical protein
MFLTLWYKVTISFSTLAINSRLIRGKVVTIMNKRKALSVKEKVTVIREIENGKKNAHCLSGLSNREVTMHH